MLNKLIPAITVLIFTFTEVHCQIPSVGNKQYIVYPGKKITGSVVQSVTTTQSDVFCAMQCMKDAACSTYNVMESGDQYTCDFVIPDGSFTIVDDSNWNLTCEYMMRF